MNRPKIILIALIFITILTSLIADFLISKTDLVYFVSYHEIMVRRPGSYPNTIHFYFPPNTTSQYNDIAWRCANDDWIEIAWIINGDGEKEIDYIFSW